MKGGISFVISAPSGTGKSTLCGRLLEEFPEIFFSVSCATREIRQGEREGVDYHFISKEEFLKLVDHNEFAEWADVHGNYYGTPIKPALAMLRRGRNVLFDVDVQGALQIKNRLPEAVFIFILPPDIAELEQRLIKRGKDAPESLKTRLGNARMEIREAVWYDYIIVNDNLDTAYDNLRAIYLSAMHKAWAYADKIEALLRAEK